ncbi:MAG: metallophosphoesterase [Helicobacteraceae bacterium]|nr:metallophosphoesterase [Helicobacteraceae bacterium]
MHHSIRENAIFIADAHHHSVYQNTLDSLFIELLKQERRQIFLLGDIFDFLVDGVCDSIKDNVKTLDLLEKLSLKHEVYYFEGNHDFLLKGIPQFKNIIYFSLKEQPSCFEFNGKKCYLAHGDIFLNWQYNIYTKILRQKKLVTFLNFFSFYLYKKIINYLKRKNKKKYAQSTEEMQLNFAKFAESRIDKYHKKFILNKDSYIIEGHFHLGKTIRVKDINYIGLPFFACKKRYFVVECENNCLILKEF